MAKVISRFSKKRFKYDWDRWTSGKIFRVQHGEDFNCSPYGFRMTLYSKARRRGQKVRVSSSDDGVVEFQFLEPTSV